ncbi:MAG TPA: alkaline phosphatase family protein [Dehalococcoidia bacterium]|nr:alkaline phosphatase family protein [Dehalococcoidia bacterium]
MTTAERPPHTGEPVEPERLRGQGLDEHQYESGDRAIHAILTDPTAGPQTDMVITWREDAYEIWAARGMIRFQRFLAPDGHGYEYNVIEQIGANPVENQDRRALTTIADELAASRASGFPGIDANTAYVEPEHNAYPFAYERIAQLFDSPNAPDLVVNPKAYAFGRQPGQHGALDAIQARSPLIFSGPGVRRGELIDAPARQVDIAPTIAHLCGLPLIDGMDATGRTSSERSVPPDVYLKRQDGRVLAELLDPGDARRPARVYILLLDGQSNSELKHRLAEDADAIPHLRRLIRHGAMLDHGSFTNFPSITWPSHNAIGTGAWGGHHDIVNPTYYVRESREVVTPQGQQFDTAKFLGDGVETLYEAFHRVFGPWQGQSGAFTASIHEPCTRGADHATLERRVIGDRDRLKALTARYAGDTNPRWEADGQKGVHLESLVENRGLAQSILLYTDDSHPPPRFMFHEFAITDGAGHDYGPHSDGQRAALDETDVRIGRILETLESRGLLEDTLFVITTDHGMAPTDASLKATQVRAVTDAGIKAVTPDPLVYLIDMAVTVTRHEDGRTAMVEVLANDADAAGERPPVAGAEVVLSGHGAAPLARARTDAGGTCGLPLPLDAAPADLYITVHHDDFNPRHLRLDGTPVRPDLRTLIYGAQRHG